MAYQTINPYTNEVEKTYENHDDAYVESALTKAHALYKNGVTNHLPDAQRCYTRLRKYSQRNQMS